MTTTPTQERLRSEWRAIYRGWQKRGHPKDEKSPVLRLAEKHKISCQEVKRIIGRPNHWGSLQKPEFLRFRVAQQEDFEKYGF